jgi:hypothetical protein
MVISNALPKGIARITLIYRCGKCDSEYWVSHIEAQTPGFMFVCGSCRTPNHLEHVKVKCVVSKPGQISYTQPVKKKCKKSVKKSNNTFTSVQKIICGYGYTKKDAVTLITQATDYLRDTNQSLTKENLLKCAFSHCVTR